MPSKKSKPQNKRLPWKAVPGCSEKELIQLAAELAGELRSGDRVLLEGPMGAGKTTFARALLSGLGVHQPAEGSPTFAIAHEYDSPKGGVVHLDFYRLKDASEIDEAGIPAYYWERQLIVISEWLSSWPEFESQVQASGASFGGQVWRVDLAYSEKGDDLRSVELFRS